MGEDDTTEDPPSTADVAPTEESPGVPAEQRGAADEDRTPEPQPVGERAGGVGAGGAGAVLESPGGPGTISQEDEEEERETTLSQELVEEETISEISPEMGHAEANPRAGGARFDELVAKRQKQGLTDDEADELGRLIAEREGREWTSTRSLKGQFKADTA